jgi:hypothetical protein
MPLPSPNPHTFGRDSRDRGMRAMRAIAGPPLVLDFCEAGSLQPFGQFVNRPAVGRDDFVVEGGNLVTVEEADHEGASRGDYPPELGEHAI